MRRFPRWLWISAIILSVIEWGAIPLVELISDHAIWVLRTIIIFSFVIFPLYLLISLLMLPKGNRGISLVILLIPFVAYLPMIIETAPAWIPLP